MAIALRNSTQSGANDVLQSSNTTAVPSGSATGDIAVLVVETWIDSTGPTVTFPAGFTEITAARASITGDGGPEQIWMAWKRLTANDTGSYAVTFSKTCWNIVHCITFSGGLASGDPVDFVNTATGTGTAIPTTTGTATTLAAVVHGVANVNGTTATPPTSYIERHDSNCLKTSYRILTATGSTSATGGVLAASTSMAVALVGIKPDGGASPVDLVTANAAQAQTAESPALTQVHALAVDAGMQVQSAGTPTLTQVHILSVSGASQAQASGSPTLVQNADLTVQGALQAQSSTDVALTQVHVLTVQAADQAQAADTVSLSGAASLSVDNALHSQAVGVPALTQLHVLTVDPSAQAQASDTVVLTGGASLTVADVTQAQSVQAVTLTQLHVLLVDGAGQSQQASLVAFQQVHQLQPAGAIQAQESTTVDLVAIGAFEPPDEVEATPRSYISTTTLGGAVSTAIARVYESTATVRSPE